LISWQESIAREVFLVAGGVAKLVFSEPNGHETLVALRYPGQFVDYWPRQPAGASPLSAIALVTSEIYRIDIATVQSAQEQNPDLRIQDADLLRYDLDDLVARFVRSKLPSPADRLEQLLRELAAVLGRRDSNGKVHVMLPFDNFEFASLCGVSESYYKVVRHELAKSGRVRQEGRRLWVLAPSLSSQGPTAEA
jgi:CRP-like cAMP-binding protein